MKKIVCIGVLWFMQPCQAQEKISLDQAIGEGKVTTFIKGNGNPSKDTNAYGRYIGACMTAYLTNKTDQTLFIEVVPGALLVPENDTVQTMLVTSSKTLRLPPNKMIKVKLDALCTEIEDAAPSARDVFTYNSSNDLSMLDLAKTISKKDANNFVGQFAVWAYANKVSKEALLAYCNYKDTLIAAKKMLDRLGLSHEIVLDKEGEQTSAAIVTTNINSSKQVVAPKAGVASTSDGSNGKTFDIKNTQTQDQTAEKTPIKGSWPFSLKLAGLIVGVPLFWLFILLFRRRKEKEEETPENFEPRLQRV